MKPWALGCVLGCRRLSESLLGPHVWRYVFSHIAQSEYAYALSGKSLHCWKCGWGQVQELFPSGQMTSIQRRLNVDTTSSRDIIQQRINGATSLHDVYTAYHKRRCNVMTWCYIDVEATLFKRHVPAGLSLNGWGWRRLVFLTNTEYFCFF